MPNSPSPALVAWRTVPRLPEALTHTALHVVAVAAWARQGKGVRQFQRNLARVQPLASRRQVRRWARRGMVAYMRYYGEIFQTGRLTPERVNAIVDVQGREHIDGAIAAGHNPILALAHMGNWDLAGAWATLNLGAVTTVAERLDPPELFEDFVAMRAALGITIVPADPGRAFRPLLEAALTGPAGIVPVLADRDLGRGGVEVSMFGRPVRVAAGPAVLACQSNRPLVPLAMVSERLSGARRRAARTRRGYRLIAFPEIPRRPDLDRTAEVHAMTQGWVSTLAGVIAAHPPDWHMLQKVFVEDLDPARDAAVRGDPGAGTAEDGT